MKLPPPLNPGHSLVRAERDQLGRLASIRVVKYLGDAYRLTRKNRCKQTSGVAR
jgi:hypothetical protein